MNHEERYTTEDIYQFLKNGETLEYADLRESQLIGIDLAGISLRGADLQYTDLRHANLERTILEDANLQGANLSGASLKGAHLSGANLDNARLDNASLLRTTLCRVSCRNASFSHGSLRLVDITESDFTGANFHGANLRGAKGALTAKFNNTDLTDARGDETLLDVQDLKAVGANTTNIQGVRVRVFDFLKVDQESWFQRLKKSIRDFGKKKLAVSKK